MSKPEVKEKNSWFGRSLDNYKKLHKGLAEEQGKIKALNEATTLTQARKILFGVKKNNR